MLVGCLGTVLSGLGLQIKDSVLTAGSKGLLQLIVQKPTWKTQKIKVGMTVGQAEELVTRGKSLPGR